MSASSSDKGGFAVCWVMAVRGVASHKPSSSNGKGRWPLTLAQRVFLVLVTKLITTGFVGCAKKRYPARGHFLVSWLPFGRNWMTAGFAEIDFNKH